MAKKPEDSRFVGTAQEVVIVTEAEAKKRRAAHERELDAYDKAQDKPEQKPKATR